MPSRARHVSGVPGRAQPYVTSWGNFSWVAAAPGMGWVQRVEAGCCNWGSGDGDRSGDGGDAMRTG